MGSFLIAKADMSWVPSPEPQDPSDPDAPEPQNPALDWPRLQAWLPAAELDCLELAIQGMRQHAIGALLGITQNGVSVRLQRVRQRIQFLITYPELNRRQMAAGLIRAGLRIDEHLDVFWWMYRTTSVMETSRRLRRGYSHTSHVWAQIGRALEQLNNLAPTRTTRLLERVHRQITEHPRILFYVRIEGVNRHFGRAESITFEQALDRAANCRVNRRVVVTARSDGSGGDGSATGPEPLHHAAQEDSPRKKASNFKAEKHRPNNQGRKGSRA